jgi:hypothetical protein
MNLVYLFFCDSFVLLTSLDLSLQLIFTISLVSQSGCKSTSFILSGKLFKVFFEKKISARRNHIFASFAEGKGKCFLFLFPNIFLNIF